MHWFLAITFLVGGLCGARATDVDFKAVMKDLKGDALTYCQEADKDRPQKCVDTREWTLRDLAVSALVMQEQNEAPLDQVHRAALAQAIYVGAVAELDSKDTDALCEAVGRFVNRTGQSAVLTMRAWEVLDPARLKKAANQ